jgi:NTE family protein
VGQNIARGLLHAVTVSTTHVGSGKTVVFVESGGPLPPWGRDPTIEARPVRLGPEHALASAAIPFLFPAVHIGGEFYCDGGLRQNVPLSPARRLGAEGLIVISPRYIEPLAASSTMKQREEDFPAPLFLLGKALNALLLDRVDNDLDRLERINVILEAGSRRFGPGFLDALNEELARAHAGGGPVHSPLRTRTLRSVLIRASDDIGRMAGDYVRSAEFTRRAGALVSRALRTLAEAAIDSDLLSYLLFDGEFAGRLIELGRRDAQARHDELMAFFEAMFALRRDAGLEA